MIASARDEVTATNQGAYAPRSANEVRSPLPSELSHALERLRQKIRSYAVWEGIALVGVAIGALFWTSFLLDAAYFNLSRLELPRWLRAAFLIAGLALLAAVAVTWIGLRVFRQMRQRALALLLERRFPQLGEGVITAVEAAEGGLTGVSPYHQAMVERTMADAARAVDRLDLATVFNPQPLKRALILVAALAASIVGLAAVDLGAMDRWVDGFIHLQDSYWPRSTDLVVRVLTQPGDRIREFHNRHYRHPRGGDLTLIVDGSASKSPPDRVRLDYRLAGGGVRRVYLTRIGDQPFQHTFPALLDRVDVWVSSGDFAMSRPLGVEVVEPPRLDQVVADTLYPDYTGLNRHDEAGRVLRTENPVQGTQLAVPLGSDLILRGRANKPLQSVRLDVDVGLDRYELHFGVDQDPEEPGRVGPDRGGTPRLLAWLTLRSRDGRPQLRVAWPAELVAGWLSADRESFALPLLLSPTAPEELFAAVTDASSGKSSLPVPAPWPADALLRIHLEDADGIGSAEPHKLILSGIVDQPPVIEAALDGVGTAITRMARVPVSGLLRDDYGVVAARFEFQIDQQPEWQPREFVHPLASTVREFQLSRSDDELFERFDVLPLDLSVKQKLTLTVVADDGDTLTGPHRQRSQKFVFTIVPVEELLSILYAKELNLRKRFEQILTELKDLDSDLKLHRDRADELRTLREPGRAAPVSGARPGSDARDAASLESALTACAERALHGIRKNATETASIAEAFREIRAELVNNGAETPQNLARLDDQIIGPLDRITGTDYPAADASLGLFKLANDRGEDPAAAIDATRPVLAGLIERMERILLEMRKLETFHEALELLKSIINDQDGLKDETKTQRKAKALKALGE